MASADVVVLGAGPAGLAAAWRAAAAGREVVVLDRADRPGGLAASFEVAGQRVDHGSHRLHPSIAPGILAELERLLDGDLQVRPRHGRIRLAERWIGFPLRTGDLLRGLPPALAARAAFDAATGPLRRALPPARRAARALPPAQRAARALPPAQRAARALPPARRAARALPPAQRAAPALPPARRAARAGDDSFADVVRAGLGPAVAEAFYYPYMRKIWAVEPDQLAGELARRRVSAGSPAAVLRRLARGARPEGRTFLYPRLGFGQIVDRLAGAAVDAGVDLRLGTTVDEVHIDGERRVVNGIDAAHVWSTIPLPALARAARPAPPGPVLDAAARLTHRAAVLVYLVLDRPRYTEFDAHYFPAESTPLSRLSEPKNYRDSDADPPDRTVLCAEVPCSVGDETWRADPDALGAMVAAALERDGLPATDHVAVEVRRAAHVYPVYRRGFEWDVAAVDLWAGAQPGLLTFGRQGLFAHDNTHHALATGWAAAAALGPDGRFDHDAWAAARAAFRLHVVED